MTALVQVPTFEEALLGVDRRIGGNLPDRTATIGWPYYEMTRKSVEGRVKQQQAETQARQQDELIRNIAMQARIPEETLRRLVPPTIQVSTDGISQVVEANNRELRQTMRDTLQATFDISQENLRKQARQSGLIGDVVVQRNQGRMQDAERMAAVTVQLAEVVNRLPPCASAIDYQHCPSRSAHTEPGH